MAMPSPTLIILILCLTDCVLQDQDLGSEVDTLEKELQQGCGSTRRARERLNWLEEKLAHQEKYNFTGDMIEIYVFKFMTEHFRGLHLSSRMDVKPGGSRRLGHAMKFPAELVESVQARGVEQKLVCIYIDSPCIFQDAHNSSVLNNNVLGAFLQSGHVAGLSQPVEIQFWHDMVLVSRTPPWAQAGGVPNTSVSPGAGERESVPSLHCDQKVSGVPGEQTESPALPLSPLPTRMPPTPPVSSGSPKLVPAGALSPAQLASLTHISTIGCSLSAAATLCTLLLCCFPRKQLRDNTTRIHMHLLAALLLLNCSFLLSEPLATGAEGLCRVTAALLHASLLCALAWMAAEAFHLLLLLVKVYNVYIRHYLLKLSLFAWGLPTLAVVAVFVFRRDTYGYHTISTSEGYSNVTMCWLTSPPAHHATLCYASLILLFNTLVLGRVVMILRRMQRQKGQARKDWATVLGLTCLLGTTWGLAFFSFGVFLIPQLYLFTILNSLQGLFICLWYVTVHRRSKMGSVSNTSG
ncbi:adhesion G-protein coupled receptor G5 isoform X3 [Tyto alba]|uniref:adhesion G-protein coupled receptor G5 isoform X3 n=1 Tax=Tyto alba TaxID=56313 RepID=UPI001C676127|nr:adhesion G-protein coupled receptor G5 isoform X3 [Tyto alba]